VKCEAYRIALTKYYYGIKPRMMRWVGIVTVIGQNRTGKRPHGKPRNRWENIINMNLKQTGWNGINCIYLTPNREK
jgi:hypothetical protein